MKSQVLAGGRGLGTFKNGLKGGVHIVKTSEVEEYASKDRHWARIADFVEDLCFLVCLIYKVTFAGKMLGQILVTKQTGAEGKPVNKV